MSRGFVILSQDVEGKRTYQQCAEALARSIKNVMPNANISIITDNKVKEPQIWDQIIPLPYGDLNPNDDWKLANEWQVYEASPYDETIKLEADMFIPRSIEHWWDVLSKQDISICSKIRDFKGELSDVKAYRRFIYDNNLPDTYNAITYFKKSNTAKKFFDIVRNIFENWEDYKTIVKCNKDEQVTADWAYALASLIIGPEKTLMPSFNEFSMVHMKQFIIGGTTENWTDTFIYEIIDKNLRIHTCPQLYPFHYHVKSFSNKLLNSI